MHWPLHWMVPLLHALPQDCPRLPGGGVALHWPLHWMVPLLHALLQACPRVDGSRPLQVPSHWMVPPTPHAGLAHALP